MNVFWLMVMLGLGLQCGAQIEMAQHTFGTDMMISTCHGMTKRNPFEQLSCARDGVAYVHSQVLDVSMNISGISASRNTGLLGSGYSYEPSDDTCGHDNSRECEVLSVIGSRRPSERQGEMVETLMRAVNFIRKDWMCIFSCLAMLVVRIFFSTGRKRFQTRLEKRRSHLSQRVRMNQLRAMIFMISLQPARTMDQSQFFDQVAELSRAASNAAAAAAQAVQAINQRSSSSTSGLESATRVLKAPDVFTGENPLDFLSWKSMFESWLCFGDNRFGAILANVEKRSNAVALTDLNTEQQELSTRFYAILCSYLRGRCSALVRSYSVSKHGFGLWFDLCKEYIPSTRQRSLSLAQALSSYPNFNSKLTLLESVLQYEQLVQSYETSSGATYPSDLKTATLLRCAPTRIREHLQLSLREDSSYSDVREAILAYERVTKGYSTDAILKQLSQDAGISKQGDGGVQDMEVDLVTKGKDKGGKGKGKQHKGKGKGWWNAGWSFGRGRGRGKGFKGRGSKGKQKGKKGKSKGKSFGKSSKGKKGKNTGKNDGCFICGDYNHWSGECPNRMVNYVGNDSWYGYDGEQDAQYTQQQSNTQQQATANVNQVQGKGQTGSVPTQSTTYRSQPSTQVIRRVFNLGLPASSSGSYTRMVVLEHDTEDVQMTSLDSGEELVIILDSGSDVSLLPESFASDCTGDVANFRLRDCQGSALSVHGLKHAELTVADENGEEVILQQQFIVGNVTNGLLSLGQMMKRGWTIVQGSSTTGVVLQSPGGDLRIPVCYKGSSLAFVARVRCVTHETHEDCEPVVRSILSLSDRFDSNVRGEWQMTTDGTPFMRYFGSHHMDCRPVWGHYWPYRTTLISADFNGQSAWKVVEHCYDYLDDDDCGKPIAECGDVSHDCIVVLSVGFEELSVFGQILDEEPRREIQAGPIVPAVQPQPERQGPDIGHEPDAIPLTLTIQDIELSATSPVHDLRNACRFLGVSQAGSKRKMYERICKTHLLALRREAIQIAEERYQGEVIEPRAQNPVRQPSDRERQLHMLTHLPFRAWCPFCVSCKSKDDKQSSVPPVAEAQREHPVIQLDIMYGPEQVAILLLVDCWTRWCKAIPMKTKSAKFCGRAIVEFLGEMGHFQKAEVCCDNEPTLIAAQVHAKTIRNANGLELLIQQGKMYDKGRTAVAERAVQTVRNQAKTLVACLEDFAEIKFDSKHPIHLWAFSHASWLVNRFHIHSALRMTPYQAHRGKPFNGRVVGFGSVVFGLDGTVNKNKPKWIKGLWVGKDDADHDLLITSGDRMLKAKAVRQTGDLWNTEMLVDMKIGPGDLVKGKSHSQVRVPFVPAPMPRLQDEVPGPGPDEAASDPESEQGRELEQVGKTPSFSEIKSFNDEQTATADDVVPTHVDSPTLGMPAGSASSSSTAKRVGPELSSGSEGRKFSKLVFDTVTQKHVVVSEHLPPLQREPPSKAAKVQSYSSKHGVPEGATDERSPKTPKREDAANQVVELQSSDDDTADGLVNMTNIAGVEIWVDDVVDVEEEVVIPMPEEYGEKDGPPQLNDEDLQVLDNEAALEEISRLKAMRVLEDCNEPQGDELILDTRLVYDWRHRGEWKRRARLVAREFRTTNDGSDEFTFSPTSSMGAMKCFLAWAVVCHLFLCALDVKDAFLTVDQQEAVLIETPSWVHSIIESCPRYWRLLKCLPGQRNAAMRWSEHFRSVAERHGFNAFTGMTTVFRHESRTLCLTIHVDDILLVGSVDDIKWFSETFGSIFTMKSSEVVSVSTGGELSYLKKRITLFSHDNEKPGLLLQPNKGYVPKLVNMFQLELKKPKSVPHHVNLQIYNPETFKESDALCPAEATKFRSGLGITLYVSHDRPDIQHAVRILSSYMSMPSKNALVWLKHLCLYLKGTEDAGVFFHECEFGTMLPDHWNIEHGLQQRPGRADVTVEVYSDSNWGGCSVTRKSTSSACIAVCGCIVHSHSRGQGSIALSSCEAELIASSSALAEGLQISQIMKFLAKDEQESNSKRVETILYTDSSSSRALLLRRGQGRLKHLSIRHLWIQDMVQKHMVTIVKIATQCNPSDLNTKALSAKRREFLLHLICMFMDGEVVKNTGAHGMISSGTIRSVTKVVLTLLLGAQGAEPVETNDSGSSNWMLPGMITLLCIVIGAALFLFRQYIVRRNVVQHVEAHSDVRERKLGYRYPLLSRDMVVQPQGVIVWLYMRCIERRTRLTSNALLEECEQMVSKLKELMVLCRGNLTYEQKGIVMSILYNLHDLTEDANSPINRKTEEQIHNDFLVAFQAYQYGLHSRGVDIAGQVTAEELAFQHEAAESESPLNVSDAEDVEVAPSLRRVLHRASTGNFIQHGPKKILAWLHARCNLRMVRAQTEEKADSYRDRVEIIEAMYNELQGALDPVARARSVIAVRDMVMLSSDEESPTNELSEDDIHALVDGQDDNLPLLATNSGSRVVDAVAMELLRG